MKTESDLELVSGEASKYNENIFSFFFSRESKLVLDKYLRSFKAVRERWRLRVFQGSEREIIKQTLSELGGGSLNSEAAENLAAHPEETAAHWGPRRGCGPTFPLVFFSSCLFISLLISLKLTPLSFDLLIKRLPLRSWIQSHCRSSSKVSGASA